MRAFLHLQILRPCAVILGALIYRPDSIKHNYTIRTYSLDFKTEWCFFLKSFHSCKILYKSFIVFPPGLGKKQDLT